MTPYHKVYQHDSPENHTLLILAGKPNEPLRVGDLVVLPAEEFWRLMEDRALAESIRERATQLAQS
jgi:hypothetical protein